MTKRSEIILYFCIGLLFTLAVPALFPSIRLFYMIPFLIRCYYKKPLSTCLWIALGTGLILDLFSVHGKMGLYSANYVITTYFLYRYKRNFFEDSLTTLPFMTFFFSFFSTFIQIILLFLIDGQSLHFSIPFVFVDFFLLPFSDALFAACVFSLPTFFFGKPSKKGSDYFLSREEGS